MDNLEISDKEKYLNENYPFAPVPNLNDFKQCLHCDEIFIVKDYKVLKDSAGVEYICCPHAPVCDGTIIDWVDIKEF